MSQLIDRMNEGGPLFMYPILIVIIAIIALLVISLMGKRAKRPTSEIIGHLSLFAMMWGFLGSTLGLITAFDAIEGSGNISQPMMAGGLKVALLCTLFGLFTFVIGRLSMLVLTIKAQQEERIKV
ncbi:biopolymer transporter ExbD [Dokdonia sp. Dokd-P16]|uniref:MotA/TolQ/ExbB proton channel family protein n=1 Tax=Dokdonia sp. Dokd-P16 TaxID=2173169 RepID=UPI000D545F95|nr:MotA/TolQ/ExbB proton channel family protein [Dokdonia sp. Dokd-P16]AWH74505.1 biopolymer transporter ExbD [Dokdonia sp. Dokd-P16]